MHLKSVTIALCLGMVRLALAQNPPSIQADGFHIGSCATPCVAQLALTQVPTGPVTIYLNGVLLGTDLYQIDASNGPQAIIVSFSASAGNIQDSDLVVAAYPTSP